MSSNDNNDNPPPPPPPGEAQGILRKTIFLFWYNILLGEDAPPLGFEDAVEQQPDLDEENRRRFPQIPLLAFHPWEGIEQQQIDDDDDDDDDDDNEQEMDILEDNLNHEQEQLNRLQGISIETLLFSCLYLIRTNT
jgi:hypothetical protein